VGLHKGRVQLECRHLHERSVPTKLGDSKVGSGQLPGRWRSPKRGRRASCEREKVGFNFWRGSGYLYWRECVFGNVLPLPSSRGAYDKSLLGSADGRVDRSTPLWSGDP
jgi:hypothetical protein